MPRQRSLAVLAALFVATIGGLLIGCTASEKRLQDHTKAGYAFLNAGHVREAVLEFRNALKLRPDDPALYEQLGKALVRAQQPFEGLPYIEQAYLMDPSRTEAALYLARLVAASQPERARDLLNPVLASNPDDDLTQQTLALVLLHEGRQRKALQAARRAVELDPENVDNWIQLGTVYKAKIRRAQDRRQRPASNLFKLAISAYDHVDKLKGGWSRARIEKARVYSIWPGHQKQGQATFIDALSLAQASGSPLEIKLAAWAMDEYGQRRSDAKLRRRALRAILEVDEDNYEAWRALGWLVDRQPEHSGEELYSELLERRPDDPRSYLAYAGFLVQKERRDDAEAVIRGALDDGIDGAALQGWLIRARILDGQIGDAVAISDEMINDFPDDRETRIASVWLALAQGRPEEAANRLHRILATEQTSELLRLLALAEYRQGRLAEASRAIERASISVQSISFPILRLRARIAHDSGQFQNTVETIRILIGRGQKLDDGERTLLATALHRTDRRDDSLSIFENMLEQQPPPRVAVLAFVRLEGENDPTRAYQLLQQVLLTSPNDFEIVEALTKMDLAAGRAQLAVQRLNQLAAARLVDPPLLLLRARVLARLGAWDASESDVLRAFEADPKLPGAVDLLFTIYTKHDQLDVVRASFEQAEKSGLLHPGARILLARLYLAEENFERTREMLEIVVEEVSGFWTAQNDLAYVLAELGVDLDRALQLARQAHVGSGRLATTADTVGWVHLKAGRYDSAITYFARAIKLSQQEGEKVDPAFRYHRGVALLGLGRITEAIDAFESALSQGSFLGAEDARRQLEAAHHQQPEPASSS
ncbi:MAG: tetratricopeptide repeat protein [Myxococcales bacterium]|nr:tetratricopeptide repeat protein [Myxococcales bacterium]